METTSAVWLGLTFGCARCHDHKYDPISQKEFYQFFAFFHNIDEPGKGPGKQGNFAPVIQVPDPDLKHKLAALDTKIAAQKTALASLKERLHTSDAPMPQWQAAKRWSITSSGGAKMKRLRDGSYLATGKKPDRDVYQIHLKDKLTGVTGIMVEALPHRTMTNQGLARSSNGNFVLSGVTVEDAEIVSATAKALVPDVDKAKQKRDFR